MRLVVDCSGPFQLSGTQLIEAAIGARCHYVDIADSRAFVPGSRSSRAPPERWRIRDLRGQFDPGLTNAVLDSITSAWLAVDSIDIAICRGTGRRKGDQWSRAS